MSIFSWKNQDFTTKKRRDPELKPFYKKDFNKDNDTNTCVLSLSLVYYASF